MVLLQFYSQIRGLQSLQYYAVFIISTSLFGYYLQTAIGVEFLTYSTFPDAITSRVFVIVLLNVIGLVIGAEIQVRRRKNHRKKEVISQRLPLISTYPSFLILLILLSLFIVGIFGFNEFVMPRNARIVDGETSAYVAFLFQVLKLIPYVISIAMLSALYFRGNRGVALIAFVAIFLLSIMLSNPANTARFISLTALSLLLVFWLSFSGKVRSLPLLINFSPLLLVVLLPITSQLRHGLSEMSLVGVTSKFSSLEFSSVQMMNAGQAVSTAFDGTYTLSGLLIFVPRAIIPWKADSLGIAIAEQSGFTFFNSAVPSYFSSYMDFGLIGVLFFSVVAGYILAWARIENKVYWFLRGNFYKLAVFALVPIFARGDFSTFMISFYAIVTAYEITRFFARLNWARSRRN
jgi:hypothetical protein